MSWQLGLGWWDGTTQKWMILGPILEEELVQFADGLNMGVGMEQMIASHYWV